MKKTRVLQTKVERHSWKEFSTVANATRSNKVRNKDSPLNATITRPLKGYFSQNLEIRNSLEWFEMNCIII